MVAPLCLTPFALCVEWQSPEDDRLMHCTSLHEGFGEALATLDAYERQGWTCRHITAVSPRAQMARRLLAYGRLGIPPPEASSL